MPKKRRYRKRKPKLKLQLRKNTVYSIFSFGLLLAGLIILLSFTKSEPTFIAISNSMEDSFGVAAYLFPFVLIFLGFLFLRLKFFLSRPNVSVGFSLFFISFMSLLKAGAFGRYFFTVLEEIISPLGAMLVYIVGVFIGLVVFFDTSIDELGQVFLNFGKTIKKFIPKAIINYFKVKKSPFKDTQIKIKGGDNKDFKSSSDKPISTKSSKKDTSFISDKLVANTPMKEGVWEYPPLSLLSDSTGHKADRGDIKKIAATIERTLQSFGVGARVVEVNLGPAVTQYALEIAQGTKISKITSLSNDLALATEAPTGQIRIEAPIPGRSLVGIEIPNRSLEVVTLKTMLMSDKMQKSKSKLAVSLGLDVSGDPLIAEISKMPHVLVAGTTGSGKSVLINSFISSLLFRTSPEELRLILIDPKRVELTMYNGIPHLMTEVIVDVDKILASLKWAMDEMDRRYKKFAENGVRNIDSYNELSGFQAMPYIVILIDELADLMTFAPVQVEDAIARLAQMARATGIHLVIATQRPSVDVITGLIKANVPCRIAFNVSSMIDSRVILDTPGAEKLLGRGDMLYIPPDQAKPTRIQGAFVSEKEVKRLVEHLKTKNPRVQYTSEVTAEPMVLKKGNIATSSDGKDPLYTEVVQLICQYDKASASLLQRRFSIGYSRAARILDQLEADGVVGAAEGSKPRDVLIKNPEDLLGVAEAGRDE